MARNSRSGSKNNNPEGRNQYSSGWVGTARDNPLATAATAAAAVGAGVFLWSKRAQISEQIGQLGEQVNSWREELKSVQYVEQATGNAEPFAAKPAKRSGKKTQAQIAEEALTLKETGEPSPTGL